MTAADTVLACVSLAMLGLAIYQLGKVNGVNEGWDNARKVWRPWVDREIKSADDWRGIAFALRHKPPQDKLPAGPSVKSEQLPKKEG